MDYHVSTLATVIIALLAMWELVWKGLALWRAGQRHEVGWFSVLLVINTAGILPMIYLLTTKQKSTL